MAAMAFRADILDALLLSGRFDISEQDSLLRTPLQVVCRAGKQRDPIAQAARIVTIKRLLATGSNILEPEQGGLTPVAMALADEDYDLMRVIAHYWDEVTRVTQGTNPVEPEWYVNIKARLLQQESMKN
ncbi:hypothetical protein BJY01DRAFT_172562 [Aspergillus pseudoustus]|uniref:Ankyrin repeat-containing domain protein n=1 Tax=Aspergillus pseudoustus TaxID=1810923 RepID=A0ABR4K3I6_9EURO